MAGNFRSVFSVSSATLLSRILGLFRDILIFAALGASLWNSAFLLAFLIPNLFRRLLGEGALTSALIPLLADSREKRGDRAAFAFLNQVLLRLSVLLCALVVLGIIFSGGLLLLGEQRIGRWYFALQLTQFLLPYMVLVCLSAAFAATLNVWRRYTLPSLSPVWLNLAMIASLIPFLFGERDPLRLVIYLSIGVLIGGLFQCLVPAWDTARIGWRPGIKDRTNHHLQRFGVLLLPSLAGAAILQVNLLISRLLAFAVSPEGVSLIYLASRLIELPLGIFAIAVSTVFFPLMAAAASAGDQQRFSDAYREGVLLTLALTLPAAVGLSILGLPIVSLLFNWGAFDSGDVAAVYPLLVLYALGIPFYSLAGFLTRNFHSRQDMKTPLRAAGYTLLVNLGLSMVLILFFGLVGLVLANVFASIYQTLWLLDKELKRDNRISLKGFFPALSKVLIALVPLTILTLPGYFFSSDLVALPKFYLGLLLTLQISLSAGVYLGTLSLLGFPGLGRFLRIKGR